MSAYIRRKNLITGIMLEAWDPWTENRIAWNKSSIFVRDKSPHYNKFPKQWKFQCLENDALLMAQRTFWNFGYWLIELIAAYDQHIAPPLLRIIGFPTCHVATQIHSCEYAPAMIWIQMGRLRDSILNYLIFFISSGSKIPMAHVIVNMTHSCRYSCI